MIDQYLQELFSPDPSGPGGFAGRFGAINDRSGPLYGQGAGGPIQMDTPLPMPGGPPMPEPPMGGEMPDDMMRAVNQNFLRMNGGRDPSGTQVLPPADDGVALPPGAKPMSGMSPMFARLAGMDGGGAVPLPRPRPSGAMGPADATAPPGGNPMAPNLGALLAILRGGGGSGPSGPAPAGAPQDPGAMPREDAQSIIGRLIGLDRSGEKRLRSSVASGFAGGNPAFAGGAFMKGASGGLSGGLKSDKEDDDADVASEDKAQKQANYERTQTDKEKTSEAIRKLYGDRGEAAKTSAAARAANPMGGRSSWNKPPHERYKDAMKLIQDERKAIFGQINPLGPKADVQMQRMEADKKLKEFTDRTLRTYGIDADGNEIAPVQQPQRGASAGVPSSKRVIGDKEAMDKGLYPKGTFDDPAEPMSKEEFDALPAGTIFKNPADGRLMTKRG